MNTYDHLRVLAHPLRLAMIDVLTNQSLSASEVAVQLETTQQNAAYHLQRLVASGHVVVAGTRTGVGGTANLYQYAGQVEKVTSDPKSLARYVEAVAALLQRRFAQRSLRQKATVIDAELWLEKTVWQQHRSKLATVAEQIHKDAVPPGSRGAVRVSVTLAAFEMRAKRVETRP